MSISVVDSVRMSVRGIGRERYDRFPKRRALQAFLTWLIGCPFMGQKPLFANKPWWVAVSIPIIVLTRSLLAAFACVSVGGYALANSSCCYVKSPVSTVDHRIHSPLAQSLAELDEKWHALRSFDGY